MDMSVQVFSRINQVSVKCSPRKCRAGVYNSDEPLRRIIVDANLKKILDELPDKPPRSRLEPYREFIEELRRKGRTYRDIGEILAEKCAVQVTASGIHDFLRTRSRRDQKDKPKRSADSTRPPGARASDRALPKALSGEDVLHKIAALKTRGSKTRVDANAFEYDPDEPLRLKTPDQK
jgi:hypothetical protein